jgi:hypothetical protein
MRPFENMRPRSLREYDSGADDPRRSYIHHSERQRASVRIHDSVVVIVLLSSFRLRHLRRCLTLDTQGRRPHRNHPYVPFLQKRAECDITPLLILVDEPSQSVVEQVCFIATPFLTVFPDLREHASYDNNIGNSETSSTQLTKKILTFSSQFNARS